MVQFAFILRGALVAFLIGMLPYTLLGLVYDGWHRPLEHLWEELVVYLLFGGYLSIWITGLIVLIWLPLAAFRKRVPWWIAPLVSTLICAPIFWALTDFQWFGPNLGLVFGMLTGSAFWWGAFGRQRVQVMTFRPTW
ncbi:hypothetical protein [Aliiroseovarius sp.]|uniref:hypothetical protein n=1 Tax=Aliiroseovarius sp. TaxID=1872442 RepID=UPI003BAA4B1C